MMNILRTSGENNGPKAMHVNAEADLVQQLLINLLKTNPEVLSRAFNAAQAQAPEVSVSATSAVSAPATSAVSAPATSAVSAPVSAPAKKDGKPKKAPSAQAAAKAAAKLEHEAVVVRTADTFGVALPPIDRVGSVNMTTFVNERYVIDDALVALATRLEQSPNSDILAFAFANLDYAKPTAWQRSGTCKVDGKGLPGFLRQIYYLKNTRIESIIRYFAEYSTSPLDASTYSRIREHFRATKDLPAASEDLGNPKVAGVILAVFVKDLVGRL
jgi:hypothetical protein